MRVQCPFYIMYFPTLFVVLVTWKQNHKRMMIAHSLVTEKFGRKHLYCPSPIFFLSLSL